MLQPAPVHYRTRRHGHGRRYPAEQGKGIEQGRPVYATLVRG
jgi:hypothetical protein